MLKYLIIVIAVAALLVCLALPGWLFGTTAGARRLLDAVSRYTDIKISAEKIEGKLAGALRLENMSLQWPKGKISIQHLDLRTRPFDLLALQFSIQRLSLKNMSIQDNSPDTPPKLIWPRASGLLQFVSGKIERLDISHFTYRNLENEPLRFQNITASVAWRKSHLSVGNLQLVSDQGVVAGNVLAGFNRPLFEMDLTATLPRPLAGMDSFRLLGKSGPGKRTGELAGKLHLFSSRNKKPLWQMAIDAGMTSEGFPLKNIRLHRPGQKGLITADGMLTMSGPSPFLDLRAQAADIDLSSEFKIPTTLSGTLTFAGTSRQYRGRLTLAHQGKTWQAIRLASDYSGNAESITLNAIQGTALKGTLSGNLNIDWQNGLSMRGKISGRNLDPAGIDPGWAGVIHFDLSGNLSVAEQKPPSGEITCTLLQSRLHGQQLTGDLRATFAADDIRIQHLALQGKGFQITAQGAVKDRVDVAARISDLSLLIPKTAGSLTATGWIRRHNDRLSGVVSAQARGLAAKGLEIAAADLSAAVADQEKSPLSVNATFHKLRYQGFTADTLTLQAKGTLSRHALTAALRRGRYEAHLDLSGAYHRGSWQGKVLRLDGTDSVGPWRLVQPATLSIAANSLSFEPMIFTGRGSETLKLSGKMALESLTGSLALNWGDLNLARTNAWTNQELLTGTSNGDIHLNLLPRNQIDLTGKFSLSGTLQAQGQSVNIRQSEITLKANEQGTRAGLNIHLAQGGTLQGTFSSSSPARLSLPDEGNLNLHWQGFDLTPFSTWLPGRAKLEGKMSGEMSGKLLPNRRFDLKGQTALAQSKIHWQGQKGDVSVDLRDASITWVWREDALSGDIHTTMAEYGKLQGKFHWPIAARFPVVMNTRESLQASLTGQVREKGALSVLFPGLVQESRGELDVNLKMSGSWSEPLIEGTVNLSKAGAYLPTAGISIKDAQIAARLVRDTIHIDSFRAVSGQGYIDGSAAIHLNGLQVVNFEGRLNGERFQTIYFPELQIQSSPKLTFAGTPEKISIRGEVLLPAVQIIGAQSQGPVEASPDVVREGKTKPRAQKLPVNLDVQVKMILGDQIQFKASGIDAQLGGQLDLQFQDPAKITSRGEIRVVKGRFRTYGVNLEIVRGRLFYAGGLINQPMLDILAWRKVGDIHAGVLVSGTLQNPLTKLYSEPPMPDMDILAYIVLGHPLGSDAQQASLLATAASALLSARQSEDLLSQIKTRLGLGSLDISTDSPAQNGYMGYKRIYTTPTGAGGINTAGSVSETMLVVGKYLTPKLYISYGRSLFSGGNLFFLRYDLSKSWQIETQTGQESGIDIYYKLEFN